MCDTTPQSTTESTPQSLAEIVREVTDNGRIVVEFLADMVQGKMEGATYSHRLEAARQLEKLGLKIPHVAVIEAAEKATKASKPRKQSAAPAPAAPTSKISELAEIVRLETDNGKDIVRFLVDVVQGNHEGFKEHHRLRAAIELLRHCFGKTPVYIDDGEERDESSDDVDQAPEPSDSDSLTYLDWQGKVMNKDHAPFNFDNYNLEEYKRDRMGERARVHIFGGKEAREVARNAVRKFWRDEPDGGHDYDYDSAPVENPLDDPYGKGCYGYKALKITYQHNGAIRVANKAVAEYYKRTFKHLLNEDGSLADGADTASLDPGTLQYLERSRHLLTKNDEPPQDPDPADSQLGQSSEDTDPPSSVTPEDPPVPPNVTNPPHVTEPPNVILSEAEGSPSRDPQHTPAEPGEEPPAPTPPPRKIRQLIHVGPPGEDPPDDYPRPRGDPDEIRVPLRNLLRIRAGPL